MSFEEFAKSILKAVCEKADGMFAFSLITKMKNNGIRRTGISVIAEDSDNGLCVFLDGYYEEYENGRAGLQDIVDEVYGQILERLKDLQKIHMEDLLVWENARGRIRAALINAEKNKERLCKVPHRMFLDLAVVYHVTVSGPDNQEIGRALIHNRHMLMWKQNEETLFGTSLANMRSDGGAVFENIEMVLRSHTPEIADRLDHEEFSLDVGAYILTNGSKSYGATEILDENTLREIADEIGYDYFVLPSSVHEVIVLPSDSKAECRELADMVKEINATEVSEEEYLSDHVYVYDRKDGALKIAA